MEARIDMTEADLARTLLLAMAAHELLMRKQVVLPQQISEVAPIVDLWDGESDSRLDPAVLRPQQPQQPDSPPTAREFLRQLEQEDQS